jgi:hypothetical protein
MSAVPAAGAEKSVVMISSQPIETPVEYLPSTSIFEEFPEFLALTLIIHALQTSESFTPPKRFDIKYMKPAASSRLSTALLSPIR